MLLLHDGKPPTPEQVEKERKKISEHKLKFLGGGKPEEQDSEGDANLLVRQIELYADHFTPRLIGAETVEGRPAYVLQFLLNPENRFKDSLVNTIMKHLLIKVWIDEKRVALEVLTSIKRAGADMILTYFAKAFVQGVPGGDPSCSTGSQPCCRG